jgi:hypothetical protein
LALLASRRTGNVCVESGYKILTPAEVGNCISALNRKDISYRAVRVYFACQAVIAIREAASRASPGRRKGVQYQPRYRLDELCRLTGLAEKGVRRELRALERAGILVFSKGEIETRKELGSDPTELASALAGKRSPKRPVPIPRSVLRFLAKSERAVLGKTVLAYLFRGMSIDCRRGEVRGAGAVKASWIADVMGVSLRAAKAARKELIALGLISKDTGSFQRKLNRDGAYFRICLSWKGAAAAKPLAGTRPIAPRHPEKRTAFAPPIKEQKTPNGSKNQKAWPTKPPGVSSIQSGRGEPMLRDVQMQDLLDFSRTESLYRQAVLAAWVQDSEANLLNWVAAAVRAKSCRARDPVRVFLGIVKRGLWVNITEADEERARRAINRYLFGVSEAAA